MRAQNLRELNTICIISYSISRFDHCTNKQSHTPKTQLKIAHKNKKLSTQKFEPINQYTIKNWYKKQVMYTHNARTLETPQGVKGKKYQNLITNPQFFQDFLRQSREFYFKGTPAENLANTVINLNNGLNFHEHMIEEPLK